jgi:HMG (high mobility group) box
MADLKKMLIDMMQEQAALLARHIALLNGDIVISREEEKAEEVGKKGKKKKEPVDPNKPKKPSSAYILYMGENQAPFKAENPTMTQTEVMTALGNRWSTLPPEAKAKYMKQAEVRKELYGMKMAIYNAGGVVPSTAPAVAPKSRSPVKTSASKSVIPVPAPVAAPVVVPAPSPAPTIAAPLSNTPVESEKELKKKRKRAQREAEAAAEAAAALAAATATATAALVAESQSEKKKVRNSRVPRNKSEVMFLISLFAHFHSPFDVQKKHKKSKSDDA